MPASTAALVVLDAAPTPKGVAFNEQSSTVSPGNSFSNDGSVFLYVRNTTISAIDVILEQDIFGSERTIIQQAIPGSGTAHGVRVLGPFPQGSFGEHTTTEPASNGRCFVRQATGSNGGLVFCPFRLNRGLL